MSTFSIKKIVLFFAASCICASLAVSTVRGAPKKTLPFTVKAKSAVLMNVNSEQILYSVDHREKIPPASLTKLMTLHIAFDAIDNGYVSMSDKVKISEKAWRTDGSKMFLEVNSRVPLQLLLKGIAVVSANDACVAVAEYIAGVEDVFVEKMNKTAQYLGMTDTFFKNSHGLPADGQVTTAHDMAILAAYYINNHPEALQIHSLKELTYNSITQRNRNGLLWLDYGVDGLKTGWFSKAGFHIIATAQRDDERYIAVVMGARSETQRENIALQLLNYGFKNFTTLQVISPEESIEKVSVWKGDAPHVSVGLIAGAWVTVMNDEKDGVTFERECPGALYAPIGERQQVGSLNVLVDGNNVRSFPLVALDAVGEAGMFRRLLHGITLFFIRPPYWGAVIVLLIVGMVMAIELFSMRRRRRK